LQRLLTYMFLFIIIIYNVWFVVGDVSASVIIIIIIKPQTYMAFDLHQTISGFSIFNDLAPISQLYIL
jgi:hypothetical protein